jgi:hypothetical protein
METSVTFPRELTDPTPFKPFVDLVISSEPEAATVSDVRIQVKEVLKEIEKKRKSFTEPILEAKRRIDEEAKSVSAPFEAIVRSMDGKLIAWHESQEQVRIEAEKKRREEEAAKLEAEKERQLAIVVETGDEKAAEAVAEIEKNQERLVSQPIEIHNNTRTNAGTTYLQKRWTFEVVEANKIPREFLMVDESKLQKYATAMKDTANVPGVKFFQTASIGGRR